MRIQKPNIQLHLLNLVGTHQKVLYIFIFTKFHIMLATNIYHTINPRVLNKKEIPKSLNSNFEHRVSVAAINQSNYIVLEIAPNCPVLNGINV